MSGNMSTFLFLACICLLASPALAFGAGEVADDSHWDGYVWRHGDIEKILMILPVSTVSNYAFTKMQARQVYFGNWLRDYSQLLDVKCLGIAHESVLRGIISVLGFMEFGLATGEFDVTKERLGVYRHEHHIDNPSGYDKDLPEQNASLIDSRLRGHVDDKELEIDPETGMKNYIARWNVEYPTAAQYIREQLQQCIHHGRNGNQSEAFIHLGAALHTLEDFAAHSNYTELVLRELGEDSVFPFVGDKCRVQVPGTDKWVPPVTTGTFGMIDILHSFLGEADDKVAVLNQGETDTDLTGTSDYTNLSNKLTPVGMAFDQLFTSLKLAAAPLAKLSSEGSRIYSQISEIEAIAADASNNPPKYDPADKSEPMPDLWKTIEPVLRLHDDVARWFMENENLLKIEVLSKAVENIGKMLNALVYKFLAVLLEPSLQEARNAVKVARDEAQAAGEKSDIWGDDSTGSNPSHSDIAKDHFSNVLNQPAGLVATVITNWTTRMVVRCWDEPNQDADDMINHILTILHHPAFVRDKNDPQKYMFLAVETWWTKHSEQQRADLRNKLSKDSAKSYYDHHDHTIQASDFKGPGKDCYKKGFVFPGSEPYYRELDKSLLGKTKELIVDVSNKLNAAGQAVIDGTVEVVNVVGDAANNVVDAVGDAANDVVDTVGDGLNTVGRGIEDGADAVGGAVADAGNWVGDTAGKIWGDWDW